MSQDNPATQPPMSTSASEPADDDVTAVNEAELLARKQALLQELDVLVADLRAVVPEKGADAYSPMFFLSYIQASLERLTPDTQMGILESFEGMTREDMMDIETWKGMAYMFSYSARFQAGQVKDRLNETMPGPLKPDTTINLMKQVLDRFTPEIAKNILETFQGASREDLTDIETWKGVWYMLNYSLQFQMDKLRQKVSDEKEEEQEA